MTLCNEALSRRTAFDGWSHDRWGAAGMLRGEAGLALACIAAGGVALWWITAARARPVEAALVAEGR